MTNPFESFWIFSWLVLSHFSTLVTGCVVTFMIGLIEKYILKRPISFKLEMWILSARI